MASRTRDELLDICGRRLHFTSAGEGSPTVVLEAGLGDRLTTWTSIQPILAETTSVISYDRAGLGESDPASMPRTLQDMVTDLKTLISSAAIPGPYVLVGHSFGGQIARLYTAQNPREIMELVLIDPSHEDKYDRFETALTKQLIHRQNVFLNDPSRNTEHVDLLESKRQLYAAKNPLNAPLVVLSRGKPDDPSPIWPTEVVQRIEIELQRELLDTPGRGLRRYTIARKSGHYVHHDEPELVISVIKEIVETVRKGR